MPAALSDGLKNRIVKWHYRDESNILRGGMFNWVQWVGVKSEEFFENMNNTVKKNTCRPSNLDANENEMGFVTDIKRLERKLLGRLDPSIRHHMRKTGLL